MQSHILETDVLRNRVYEQYRGNRYIVVDIAKDADKDGDEFCVVYRALYDHGQLYSTTHERFTSMYADGLPAFAFLKLRRKIEIQNTSIQRLRCNDLS